MSQPTPPPGFDQVVKGNVDIKQLSKKKYKITFSEIGKFLIYQTWSDSSQPLNDNRSVYYQKAKKWINNFNSLNESLKASNKPLFTPTTVMEIDNHKYVFVIHKAKLSKGRAVFEVSTEEIKLAEKKMLKLPCGHHDGVRLDIDSSTSTNLDIDALCSSFKAVAYFLYQPVVKFPLGNDWYSFKYAKYQDNYAAPFLMNPLKSKYFNMDTYSFLKCSSGGNLNINTTNLEDLRTLSGDNLYLYNYVNTYLQLFPSMQNIV